MKQENQWISPDILFPSIQELLAEGRQAVFTVTGMSMWPFLCHGRDQVIVSQGEAKMLQRGDVILFQTPLGNYMLHRITALRDGMFETTGDGNIFRDGWFPISCVRARVTEFVRKGKRIRCGSLRWKLVFRLWMLLYPVRPLLLRVLVSISRLKNRQNQ